MEISERELQRLMRDVDELNREGMETMSEDIAELHSGEGRRLMEPSRRRFMHGAGLGGLTLAIGGAMIPLASLWSPAYAQVSSDKSIAAFAESVELAAVAAYGAAAKTGKITGAALTLAKTFAFHHQAHAGAFGSFAGDGSKAQPNPKLAQSVATMIDNAADQTAILTIGLRARERGGGHLPGCHRRPERCHRPQDDRVDPSCRIAARRRARPRARPDAR